FLFLVPLRLHPRRVPRIVLDFDPEQPGAPVFEGDTSQLVYFLSWAFAQRYGASHEMSEAALILRNEHKIDMTPLLTFADRDVEARGGQGGRDRPWPDAAPRAERCRQGVESLRGDDPRLRELIGEYPGLTANIEALGKIASGATERGARIRVT